MFLLLAGAATFGRDGLSRKQLVWVACNIGGAFLYSWSRLQKGKRKRKRKSQDGEKGKTD